MKNEKMFIGVVTVIESDGKILIVKEQKKGIEGKISFPGGRVDIGESIIDGAIREAKEETSLDIKINALLKIYQVWHPDGSSMVVFCLIGETVEGVIDKSNIDVGDVEWIAIEDLLKLPENFLRNKTIKRVIETYKTGKKYPLELIDSYDL